MMAVWPGFWRCQIGCARYRVRSFGNPPDHMGHKLSKGIVIDGVRYKPVFM